MGVVMPALSLGSCATLKGPHSDQRAADPF